MKVSLKWMKRLLCAMVIVSTLCIGFSVPSASAASGAINVTSALTGEKIYSGDDLQEAFAAAERGCIVHVTRSITLTQDVILKVEVMLDGYSLIRFAPDLNNTSVYYQIKLAEKGAIFCESRIRTKYISALHSYSEVGMIEENGGYVYYLEAQAPDFAGASPVFSAGDGFFGGKVDKENARIYLDVAPAGITEDAIAAYIAMDAKNTDWVTYTFQPGAANGEKVATGSTMVAAASNYDYEGSDKLSYSVIVLGDVNGNGKIDSADAALIAQFSTGVTTLAENALLAADANCDGYVNMEDAQLICQKYIRTDAYRSPVQP